MYHPPIQRTKQKVITSLSRTDNKNDCQKSEQFAGKYIENCTDSSFLLPSRLRSAVYLPKLVKFLSLVNWGLGLNQRFRGQGLGKGEERLRTKLGQFFQSDVTPPKKVLKSLRIREIGLTRNRYKFVHLLPLLQMAIGNQDSDCIFASGVN